MEIKDDKMIMKTIDLLLLFRTGNTLMVVKKMAETFEKNGIKVNLHKIEESIPHEINLEHKIGTAFPVAFFQHIHFMEIHKIITSS